MLIDTVSAKPNFLQSILATWKNWRQQRTQATELGNLDPGELKRIAQDGRAALSLRPTGMTRRNANFLKCWHTVSMTRWLMKRSRNSLWSHPHALSGCCAACIQHDCAALCRRRSARISSRCQSMKSKGSLLADSAARTIRFFSNSFFSGLWVFDLDQRRPATAAAGCS